MEALNQLVQQVRNWEEEGDAVRAQGLVPSLLKALKTVSTESASDEPEAYLAVATCLASIGNLESACGIFRKLLEKLEGAPKPFGVKARALAARSLAAYGGSCCGAKAEAARQRGQAALAEAEGLARGVLEACGVPAGSPDEALACGKLAADFGSHGGESALAVALHALGLARYFAGDRAAFAWFTARSSSQLAFIKAPSGEVLAKHKAFNGKMAAGPGWWSDAPTALPRMLDAVQRSMQDEMFGSSDDVPRDMDGLDELALYLLSLLSPCYVREIREATLSEMARRQRAFLSAIRAPAASLECDE